MGLDLGCYFPGEIKNTFTLVVRLTGFSPRSGSAPLFETGIRTAYLIRSVVTLRKKIGGAAILEWGVSNFLLDTALQFHNMARVPQSKTTDSPYKVQVLDRALAALAILAKSSSDCSLAELCPALRLHKS